MVIAINHKFTSAKADGADASLIRPSNWNDTHTITLAAARLIGRSNTGAGPAEEMSLGTGLQFSGTTIQVNTSTVVSLSNITNGLGAPAWTALSVASAVQKSSLVPNDVIAGLDSSNSNSFMKFTLSNLALSLHPIFGSNYVRGLVTSKSSAFVVSVPEGEIKGNGKFVSNSAAFTKNLNAVWAAGSGNGGRLEAAALTANTTYHLHALRKDSDGTFDWGFSTSATAPTVPNGYSWVGRFDWCYTNSGLTAIVDYTQVGNTKYLAGTSWFTSTTTLVADALYTLPVASPIPSGIRTDVSTGFSGTAGASGIFTLYANDGDALAAAGGPGYMTARNDAWAASNVKLRTNLSRQLRLNITFGGSGSGVSGGVNAVEDYTLNRVY